MIKKQLTQQEVEENIKKIEATIENLKVSTNQYLGALSFLQFLKDNYELADNLPEKTEASQNTPANA